DLRASNAAATPWMYQVSPGYFDAAGTSLLSGRTFSWHDDGNAPRVAVINREFARKLFGSVEAAIGKYFKLRDGTLVQVVGIVEDGKYFNLVEDLKPAVFFPIAQSESAGVAWLLVRSDGDLQQLSNAIKGKLRDLDHSLPVYIQPWSKELEANLFPAQMA